MKKLFIDDERFPPGNIATDWDIVRSSKEAIEYVTKNGVPSYISFDHDLGGPDTSMLFVSWLIDRVLDGDLSIPKDFAYTVHSQNPVGVGNITGLLGGFLNHLASQERVLGE